MTYLLGSKLQRLDDEQWRSVQGISAGVRAWCAETGVPSPAPLVVLLVTAEAESSLRPGAVGDNGVSIGLYQFNTGSPRALGSEALQLGFTRAQLTDPLASSWIILRLADRDRTWRALCRGPIRDALRWWTVEIERPANAEAAAVERIGKLNNWLVRADYAYRPAPQLTTV